MMPFPYDRDTRLDAMFADRERMFRQAALRAEARDRGREHTTSAFETSRPGLVRAIVDMIRRLPVGPAAVESVAVAHHDWSAEGHAVQLELPLRRPAMVACEHAGVAVSPCRRVDGS